MPRDRISNIPTHTLAEIHPPSCRRCINVATVPRRNPLSHCILSCTLYGHLTLRWCMSLTLIMLESETLKAYTGTSVSIHPLPKPRVLPRWISIHSLKTVYTRAFWMSYKMLISISRQPSQAVISQVVPVSVAKILYGKDRISALGFCGTVMDRLSPSSEAHCIVATTALHPR